MKCVRRALQGALHYGTITGLAPDTTYYYTYGDAALNLFAPESSFTMPPAVSAAAKVHFIAWADAGQANADDAFSYDYYSKSLDSHIHTPLVWQY